jgi:Protein of unknown function (DUF2490)
MRSKRGYLKLSSTPIWLTAAALALVWPRPAAAQTSQVLPEIDTYLELDPSTRINFQIKSTREGGVPVQAEIGPSLDFYIKSVPTLLRITTSAPDDSKGRLLVLSIGYRYLPQASGAPGTNRIEPVATFRVPMKGSLLVSDRNRADLDWKNGSFTWRYRNRLQIERTFAVGSLHLTPYASAEVFYESQYQKWSTTELYAGFSLPLGSKVEFGPYYEHENDTGKAPNTEFNALGLVLNLYFSVH